MSTNVSVMSQGIFRNCLRDVSLINIRFLGLLHLMKFLESKIIRLIINILFLYLWSIFFKNLLGFFPFFILPTIDPQIYFERSRLLKILSLLYTYWLEVLYLGIFFLPIYYFTKFIWFKKSRQRYKRNFKRIKKFLIKW